MDKKNKFIWDDKSVLDFVTKTIHKRLEWALIHDASAAPVPIQVELAKYKGEYLSKPKWDILEMDGNFIKSVKRLIDGEVFNLGDKIEFCPNDDFKTQFWSGEIMSFELNYKNVLIVVIRPDDEEGEARKWIENIRHAPIHKPEWEVVNYINNVKGGSPYQNEIHSVRRLKDNEVFTVGDFVNCTWGKEQQIIKFIVIENALIAQFDSFRNPLSEISHPLPPKPNPLFVTEDGKECYGEESVYGVNKNNWNDKVFEKAKAFHKDSGYILFCSHAKFEERILMNKPFFSIEEISSMWSPDRGFVGCSWLKEKLIELAKQKLQGDK